MHSTDTAAGTFWHHGDFSGEMGFTVERTHGGYRGEIRCFFDEIARVVYRNRHKTGTVDLPVLTGGTDAGHGEDDRITISLDVLRAVVLSRLERQPGVVENAPFGDIDIDAHLDLICDWAGLSGLAEPCLHQANAYDDIIVCGRPAGHSEAGGQIGGGHATRPQYRNGDAPTKAVRRVVAYVAEHRLADGD